MKSKKYKYGVSYNCTLSGKGGYDEVGGGGEGDTTLDYVGNDLQKLIKNVIDNDNYEALTKHPYIGKYADVGGKVVAVIGEMEDKDFYVLCVVFEDPQSGPIEVD